MTTYVTATLAAAHNDELQRRAALPLPLRALLALRNSAIDDVDGADGNEGVFVGRRGRGDGRVRARGVGRVSF